jgi:hypothetical protein
MRVNFVRQNYSSIMLIGTIHIRKNFYFKNKEKKAQNLVIIDSSFAFNSFVLFSFCFFKLAYKSNCTRKNYC